MTNAELIKTLKNIYEACQVKEYREPLSHAAIADMASQAILKTKQADGRCRTHHGAGL